TREAAKKQREEGRQKEWRKANPDKIKRYNEFRSLHKKHNITNEEWIKCKEYFNNSCAYCGLHVDEHYRKYNGKLQKIDLHKEHADHYGSNNIDNCIPSCLSCNVRKHDKDLEEWYKTESEHYTEKRLNKILKWLNEDWKISLNEPIK